MAAQSKKVKPLESVSEVLNHHREMASTGTLEVVTRFGKCVFDLQEGRVVHVNADQSSEATDVEALFASPCVSTNFAPSSAAKPAKRTLMFTREDLHAVPSAETGASSRTMRIPPEELADVQARVAAAKRERLAKVPAPQTVKEAAPAHAPVASVASVTLPAAGGSPAHATLPPPLPAAAPAGTAAGSDPTHRPPTLGRYQVLGRIGTGGMGSVFLCSATGAHGFKRHVAVKVLRTDLSHDETAIAALRHEAKIGSLASHPNLVRALDFGEHDRQPYLVMDYVEGINLAQMARHGAIPAPIAIKLLIDALTALSALHRLTQDNGEPLAAIHCDVSPQNLLLGTDGVCRVIDYSCARSALLRAEVHHTEGRAAYLAPERLSGQTFDARADLFSLAVVFYESLTGQRLFAGETAEATLANILAKTPIPPSHFGPNCPPAFDGVCLRALSRDPNQRFQSADEMLAFAHQAAVASGCLASTHDVSRFIEANYAVELTLLRARLSPQALGTGVAAERVQAAKAGDDAAAAVALPAQRPAAASAADEGTERVLRQELLLGSKQRALAIVGTAFVAVVLLLAMLRPASLSFLFQFEGLDDAAKAEANAAEGAPVNDIQINPLDEASAAANDKESP